MENQVKSPPCQIVEVVLIEVADTMKGSYYANPVLDEPSVSTELRKAYPEYYGKNICSHKLLCY